MHLLEYSVHLVNSIAFNSRAPFNEFIKLQVMRGIDTGAATHGEGQLQRPTHR